MRAGVLGARLPAPSSGGGVFAAVTSSPIHPAGPAEAPEPLVRSRHGCHLKPEPWAQGSTPRPPVWGLVSPSLRPGPAGARLQGQRGPVVRVLREVVARTPSPAQGGPGLVLDTPPGCAGWGRCRGAQDGGRGWGGPPKRPPLKGECCQEGEVRAADAALSRGTFPRLPQAPRSTATPSWPGGGLLLSLCP